MTQTAALFGDKGVGRFVRQQLQDLSSGFGFDIRYENSQQI
jgi:hypothetical protein